MNAIFPLSTPTYFKPDQPKSNRLEPDDCQLRALARIAGVLRRTRQAKEAVAQVLAILHDYLGLLHGLVSIIAAPQPRMLRVVAIHTSSRLVAKAAEEVRYRRGEGVMGHVLEHSESVMLERVSLAPRFLDRLALYDPESPFIAVPIKGPEDDTIGVLAAQPDGRKDVSLPERAHFLEIVANLLSQTVHLMAKLTGSRCTTSERDEPRGNVRTQHGIENMMIGSTPSMRRVFEQIRQVARWDSTVLVLGESGTGKELIASAIHCNSPRARCPLVRLNCSSLPETLLESELFGHEKGAFTGAVKQRKGRFEQADGGTLFLDEIGEISPTFQAKLLRVLQEGEFERVGGNQTVRVNVRIVAATNRDLESEVKKGNFREDLYYRLNVMPIQAPPLRERLADIPELARFLLDKLSSQQGRSLDITDCAIEVLKKHHWPGNVRELENCLERSSIMSENGVITRNVLSLAGLDDGGSPSLADDGTLDDRERLIAALEQAGWVKAKAARLLGMTPRQVAYRIQTLNICMQKI
ncbi:MULTISPECIES: nif-specific transcriptional activator NifA [Azotobacter]|uniref:nif-specific transcriptional activator NifA n=1 Tax=Azotobacter TaxID=352 RepID=UPI0000527656|nr:nif-specific transcriptional activator NifA [Azotobacter vinelandii]GLK60069.1 Nif-specific regulatory protein [Azotobacter vinelandii]SFX31874.1 Nif-specific regulatory protein [Azotobacter vinelandii]